MKIPKFLEFINESIVRVRDEIKRRLYLILNKAKPDEVAWIEKILDNIEKDNNDNKNNIYIMSISDKPDYFYISVFKDNDSEKETSQEFKIGKALKLLVPDIPSHILGNIVAMLVDVDKITIKIVQGSELVEYYHNIDIVVYRSVLGNSCMNGMPLNYFDLYYENDGVVKMIVVLDNDGQLVARCLLWNTDSGWVFDRIYYSHEKYKYKLQDWSIENGYKVISHEKTYSIKLKESIFDRYPYLDSFNYLCINKKILSNDDIFEQDDKVLSLKGTNGIDYDIIRNVKLPFKEIHDLYVFHYVSDLISFINLAIDYDSWYDDYISKQERTLDFENFLVEYENVILENKEVKTFFPNINKKNYKELFSSLETNYLIKSVLKDIHRYGNWRDYVEEKYGIDDNVVYPSITNVNKRNYFKNIIEQYCSPDNFNKNFKKIYDENYQEYLRLIVLFN